MTHRSGMLLALNLAYFLNNIFDFVARKKIAKVFLIELLHISTTIEEHSYRLFYSVTKIKR